MSNYFGNMPYFNAQAFSQPQADPNNIIVVMVQSEAEALSYPVAAGNTVLLMAFDSGTFWLKTTDVNRMPQPIRRFAFKETTGDNSSVETNQNGYVTKAEFDDLRQMIEDLLK